MPALELVLPDGGRVALAGTVTIGRSSVNTVRLADRSVSRRHACVRVTADGGAVVSDAGSAYGTWLDGRRVERAAPLREGARIRVGDQELVVERVRGGDEAGHTVVVPTALTAATGVGGRPRVRSGYALKRLEAAEGVRRWVLKDLRSGRFLRLSGEDAKLFELLDGSRSLAELMREAEARQGRDGPARLALLLAALGARGLLSGDADERPRRRWALTRTLPWTGAGAVFARLYDAGGRALLTRPALIALGVLAAAGAVAFAVLVVGRYGTPFVVARKVGIGGVVFVLGRLAVAAVHETAHGLVMASFGRPVREAGVKLFLVFPYVYVDTSEAWFEPRRRRIAVGAAGPASDLCLGGTFALCCLAAAPGAARDVCFQLAIGAYVGAFLNLNPTVERDGYHILVDALREPRLRAQATQQLRRRLAGDRSAFTSPILAGYAGLVVAWSVVGAGIAVALSLRYEPTLGRLLSTPLVWTVMGGLWVVLLVPLVALTGPPLVRRLRARVA